jgi:GntR family transcriptional repressor for pyruvate dehydrogenase complex
MTELDGKVDRPSATQVAGDRNVGSSSAARPGMEPITRLTVTEEIVSRLMQFILDAGLSPGDRLPSERELMADLGVGRSSIREAIHALRAVGAVEVLPGAGMVVGRAGASLLAKPISWGLLMTQRETEQVIQARVVLEPEIAALAAANRQEEDLAEMRSCVDRMAKSLNEPGRYLAADHGFHQAVARACGNAVLIQVMGSLHRAVLSWMETVAAAYDIHSIASLEEHRALLEAIEQREPTRARAAMVRHLRDSSERLPVVASPRGRPTSDDHPVASRS